MVQVFNMDLEELHYCRPILKVIIIKVRNALMSLLAGQVVEPSRITVVRIRGRLLLIDKFVPQLLVL